MRAISSFNFEAGMSTRECLAETAFRIRANMSAIGSVINSLRSRSRGSGVGSRYVSGPWLLASDFRLLPARFHHARDLSRQRQFAKADAAQVKLAQVPARAAAAAAARVRARGKLWLAVRFRN